MTTIDLVGIDGSVWHLMDRSSPVHLLSGMGGLHLPATTHRWAATSRRSGRRWKGSVQDSREFQMTLRVGDPEPPFRQGDDWRALDTQFWRSLSTDATARLVVNGHRSLYFRLGEDNDHVFDKDPGLYGKATYSVACVADRPEWLGEPVMQQFSFAPTEATNYFGGGTGTEGPPFVISAPSIGTTATISNVGDLPSYPIWRVTGPSTTAVVGVGDRVIPIPFSLQAGEQAIIDTEAQTITDATGRSLWPFMGSAPVDFAPVPPGGIVPIRVGMEDGQAGSAIQASLVPLYRRAW